MIKDYTNELNLYTKSISTPGDPNNLDNIVETQDIFALVQKLYDLPINGKSIQEQINRMKQGRAQAVTTDEHFVELPTGFNSPEILLELKEIVNRKRK